MKVLMFDYFLPGSIYALELGRELKDACELFIYCREDVTVSEEGIQWIPRFYSGGKGRAGALLSYGKSLLDLRKTIQKEHYDVIHVQSFKKDAPEMALYYSLRKNFGKMVHTVHNVLPHEAGEKVHKRYQTFYDFCDELIVHNEVSKRALLENFSLPEEKITVIPHGAYRTQLERIEKRKKRMPARNAPENKKVRFLMLGFIRAYKGIDILLDAVKLLTKEERSQMEFLIAGKQFQKQDPTDYAGMIYERHLEDCVEFREGHVAEEELPNLFEKTDFVLFPYRHIYGSGALLLAYTFGKPVLVSDLPAFVEETDQGRTGWIFPKEDPEGLAKALRKALKTWQASKEPSQKSNAVENDMEMKDSLEEKKKAMKQLITDKYDWKQSARKTAEVYQR